MNKRLHKGKLIQVTLAGTLTLAIVMGIGRFSYTPIFPLMQKAFPFSDAHAGFLASSNYLGYLLGALFAGVIRWGEKKIYYLKVYLVLNIASTIAMAISTQFVLWLLFRFLSGITSGLVFVLVSSILLDFLTQQKQSSWSGYFFSGTGWGIALTGVLVPILAAHYTWAGAWMGLGIISIILAVYIFNVIKQKTISPCNEQGKIQDNTRLAYKPDTGQGHHKKVLFWLILAYGCEGLGYIITGTFLVAMVEKTSVFEHASMISWTLVGLAAIPSCLLWAKLGERWGKLMALMLAYVVQAVGISLPILSGHVAAISLGALLFGGTFMGITTLAVSLARQLFPQESNRPIGYLTAAYGVGQIVGPALAGIFISLTGNYLFAVLFAVLILLSGLVFLGLAWTSHNQKVGKSATL